jgi:hypothetical protein
LLDARQHNAYKEIFNHSDKSKSGSRVRLIHTMSEKPMTICVGGVILHPPASHVVVPTQGMPVAAVTTELMRIVVLIFTLHDALQR